ncbi:copper resistance CopC family protein [Lysinibacillus yapensis]|uniref:copper resistance CopC family protein n=1 Tax=Ureibacillus yapensis TaxID=2304605 RepID=UPI0013148436|nr:copper resistance CopC family protein [Lysinibacillus yapensis]
MKRFITTAAAVLLSTTISYNVFAHSNLSGSNPADGEVVTEPLNEITLEFEGQIEQGSFIDVTSSSGQAVEIKDIIIGDGTLTGTVAEPLPNDDYQVNWSIISEDGHPLEGEFTFTVNAPETETEEAVSAEASETPKAVEETTEADNQSTEAQEGAVAEEAEAESSSTTTILIVVLLIVAIVSGLFFFRKRK